MLLDQRDRSLFVLVTHNPYGWRCNRRPRCAGASAHHACLDPEIGEQAARKLGVTWKTRCEDPSHASSKDTGGSARCQGPFVLRMGVQQTKGGKTYHIPINDR